MTELKNHSNHFFLCFNQDSYGMAVKEDCSRLCVTNDPFAEWTQDGEIRQTVFPGCRDDKKAKEVILKRQ